MIRLNDEIEALQISFFSEIILDILSRHEELSLIKVSLFAYLIKSNRSNIYRIYNGKTSNDLVYKAVSLLSGEYQTFCKSMPYILKAVHLLISIQKISEENQILKVCKSDINKISIFKENSFIDKAIEASKKMSDKQFTKEIINCV
ncbi:hypothetical protein J1907_08120 [Lysinibacillus sphaericus]|uniref:hypothetical protein n=1 Tax=Lysinibacillus sphaericus TaxID=1421 RepID=UPI001A9FA542|nr:hypothetical protein [Lysinibacillus sphaericus]QTB24007.1 hypothetical protein J1907_08120 [Lysinibacillus sphaericus]